MTRFKITVRGEGVELRGYIPTDEDLLLALAHAVEPWAIVMASYEPTPEEDPT